jgi:hypothetical protein
LAGGGDELEETNLRIATALAVALLGSIPLFGSGVGQAATSASQIGPKCFNYKATRVSSTICDYGFELPFSLTGYSRGGSSSLSYTVQCGNGTSWPMSPAAIDRRVWYKRSLTVRGHFTIFGAKDTLPAASHCQASRGKVALLTVKLRMGEGVTKTSLAVRLDSSLPWEG